MFKYTFYVRHLYLITLCVNNLKHNIIVIVYDKYVNLFHIIYYIIILSVFGYKSLTFLKSISPTRPCQLKRR